MKKNTGKAVPIRQYINPENAEDIERHAIFLRMLNKINIEDISKLEEEQKLLNREIPFKVKTHNNYLWQIYYSEFTNQYFMLVPIEDLEYSAFFYLLKKQLENKADEEIFVPISYMDYSRKYLKKSEIAELENYLWFFTKDWPLIYDVYDKQNNMSIQITGETYVYENIKSDYKIKLDNEEESLKLYKLFKALFIMQTELPHRYNLKIQVDKQGAIEIYFKTKKITYENLSKLIKEEYLKAYKEGIKTEIEITKETEKLKEIQKISSKLDFEYLLKEKQIATYLEYKRTFLGKVKYFFKKKEFLKKEIFKEEKYTNNKNKEMNKEINLKEKDYYTLEELVEKLKATDLLINNLKNIKIDIEATELKNKNIANKIKNATLYIEEIDKHTKSIFEFWKFANKDKMAALVASEETETKKIKRIFNLEEDYEDFTKQLDKKQRDILSKEETDSIFLLTTDLINDINIIAKNDRVSNDRVEELKKLSIEERRLFQNENFDIFGGIVENKIKLKLLGNIKHRESKKEKFKILDTTEVKDEFEYIEILSKILQNIKSSLEKINTFVEMPIYKAIKVNQNLDENFNVFNINPVNSIQNLKEKEIDLYKINLKENTPIVGFTNIIYYDNTNKTLPMGMDVNDEILINKSLIDIKLDKKFSFNIIEYKENNLFEIETKKINVFEYDVK